MWASRARGGRAKIYFTSNRRIHGSWSSSIPSRFLDELPEAHVQVTEAKGGFGNLARTTAARASTGWKSFGSSYTTPAGSARRRAKRAASSTRTRMTMLRRTKQPPRRPRKAAPRKRPAPLPLTIEGELVAKSTGNIAVRLGDRVFHQKFGNGNVTHIDGNKLTIAFDRAGEKRVWTFRQRATECPRRLFAGPVERDGELVAVDVRHIAVPNFWWNTRSPSPNGDVPVDLATSSPSMVSGMRRRALFWARLFSGGGAAVRPAQHSHPRPRRTRCALCAPARAATGRGVAEPKLSIRRSASRRSSGQNSRNRLWLRSPARAPRQLVEKARRDARRPRAVDAAVRREIDFRAAPRARDAHMSETASSSSRRGLIVERALVRQQALFPAGRNTVSNSSPWRNAAS